MRRYQRGGHSNHPFVYRDTNVHWRIQEAGVVTTRYQATLPAASAAAAEQLTCEEEGEQNVPPQPPPLEQAKVEMALVNNDSGIGSLHAHDEKEPTHAIAITPGMRTIAIKNSADTATSNLCRLDTSEDYRLKAIPFVLKSDAGVWLSRLPDGSIRTWAEFRMIFLDRFFPASKTSALKREITEARHEYDEPLGQYWDRFQGLLQACPNHKMGENEIYSTIYGGLTVDSKNDLNLAAEGDFSKTPFSQAKNILERLIEAKRSYETSCGQYRRGAVHVAEARSDEKLEA
ncbi:hypothetical protein SASPL_133035 [Salvia splendens]|uniref:Retrotransposon gag domain-containing protein n=1 Tax=Salvia splendens TaxID=180675 RepID=A0A8X8ZHY4_SALSN|nr:hypothetical protein SASPL_133035 [Salvia splendens]